MDFERGLQLLKQRLHSTGWELDFQVYESRLRDNLRREQLYGSSEQIRYDRATIVERLSHLAQQVNADFTTLCQPTFPGGITSGQQPQPQKKGGRWRLAITISLVSLVLATLLILSTEHIIPNYWLVVVSSVISVMGPLFTLYQWLFPISAKAPGDLSQPPRSARPPVHTQPPRLSWQAQIPPPQPIYGPMTLYTAPSNDFWDIPKERAVAFLSYLSPLVGSIIMLILLPFSLLMSPFILLMGWIIMAFICGYLGRNRRFSRFHFVQSQLLFIAFLFLVVTTTIGIFYLASGGNTTKILDIMTFTPDYNAFSGDTSAIIVNAWKLALIAAMIEAFICMLFSTVMILSTIVGKYLTIPIIGWIALLYAGPDTH